MPVVTAVHALARTLAWRSSASLLAGPGRSADLALASWPVARRVCRLGWLAPVGGLACSDLAPVRNAARRRAAALAREVLSCRRQVLPVVSR